MYSLQTRHPTLIFVVKNYKKTNPYLAGLANKVSLIDN